MGAASANTLDLQEKTAAAFDEYVRKAETQSENRLKGGGSFLRSDADPKLKAQLRQGAVITRPAKGSGQVGVPNGLIHHWIGEIFIPGATINDTIAVIHDYDNYKNIYRPSVIASGLLGRDQSGFDFYVRMQRKSIVGVVMDVRERSSVIRLDPARYYTRSFSTRVAEVRNAGERDEYELPVGTGHGFLWRLFTFTRFEERDGGVYVEVEPIALSRDVPFLLGWFVQPIIRKVSRESLQLALMNTRDAVAKRNRGLALAAPAPASPQDAGQRPLANPPGYIVDVPR